MSIHTKSVWISMLLAACGSMAFGAEKPIPQMKLPAAVQKAAAEQSHGATVRRYVQDVEGGRMEYEMEMLVHGHSKDVTFASDGRLLEVEEQVDLQKLAPVVQSALRSRAGKGTIQKVESITKQGKLVAYEAQVLIDGRHREIQTGANGERLARNE